MDAGERLLQAENDDRISAGNEICPACSESVAAEDVYCPHCGDLLTVSGPSGSGYERPPERLGSAAQLQAWLIGAGALIAFVLMLLFFAVRPLFEGG